TGSVFSTRSTGCSTRPVYPLLGGDSDPPWVSQPVFQGGLVALLSKAGTELLGIQPRRVFRLFVFSISTKKYVTSYGLRSTLNSVPLNYFLALSHLITVFP